MANRDIKSPLHPLSLMDKGMWRVKGECVYSEFLFRGGYFTSQVSLVISSSSKL